MKSEALLLGTPPRLFGVRSLPTGQAQRSVGIVILNAGMLHHVGPYGLHARLAKILAAEGFPVIRLDLSGKGESPLRPDCSGHQSLLLDYDDTLENLRLAGVERTVLLGLCSGAADAVHIANERESVAGVVLIDGFAKRSIESVIRFYSRRVFHAGMFTNLLNKFKRKSAAEQASDTDYAELFRTVWVDWKNIRRKYVQILNRDVRMLAVFTRNLEWQYNREGQLAKCLSESQGLKNLDECLIGDSDHTFTALKHRNRLIETIQQWLVSQFPR